MRNEDKKYLKESIIMECKEGYPLPMIIDHLIIRGFKESTIRKYIKTFRPNYRPNYKVVKPKAYPYG